MKGEAEAAAKRERDENLSFDEVWCVVDVDDHKHLKEAVVTANDNGIKVAVSNPCFELWLVLHFRESPGAQHREKVQEMVGGFVSGYHKHLVFDDFSAGYGAAVKRAQQIDEDCAAMGEPRRNPSTGVYRLTESIRTFRNA
jgi:hypothetical protein